MEKRVVVWVQQRKDRQTLQLQWHCPETGRRRGRTAGTNNPKEAEKARADLEYELNHGKYQEASKLTWERFRDLFEMEHVNNQRPNTQESYRATLDAFEEICQPAKLRSITERTLSKFAAGLRDRRTARKSGNQPNSVRTRLRAMRTALRWAVKQRMLTECPAFPSIKVPRKKPQPVPTEAFERLFAKAPDAQMQAFLLCGWLGGLRRAEALALEREASDTAPYLDLAGERIVLPAQFVKACEDQWIPLDRVLREALLALPHHGPKVFRFIGRHKREIGASAVGQRVADLAAQAGVKLTTHSLRKGFACRYAAKVPAQVLQRLLRHSDIKLTMDYYANVDEAVREAVLGAGRAGSRAKLPLEGGQATEQPDVNACQERTEP
jgi:integrase